MRRKEMQNSECRMTSSTNYVGPPSPTGKALGKGYEDGYRQGVRDMAERLCKYYTSLPLPKTQPAVVEYNIRVLADELLERRSEGG